MTPELSTLLQEVVAGRHDDDLNDITTAVVARVRDSMLTLAWRFQLDPVDVGELEVTLDEWSQIQKQAGVHFSRLVPEHDVDHLRAIGTVLMRTRGGLDALDAAAKVGGLTAVDVPMVITREVTAAPFDSPTPAGTSPT